MKNIESFIISLLKVVNLYYSKLEIECYNFIQYSFITISRILWKAPKTNCFVLRFALIIFRTSN